MIIDSNILQSAQIDLQTHVFCGWKLISYSCTLKDITELQIGRRDKMKTGKKTRILAVVLLLAAGLLAGCKGSTAQKEPPVEDILKAVQEAYGEDYLPDSDLDKEMLSQVLGIDTSLMESVAAQMPMIGAHPDRVVIAKAAEGKGDALEEELLRVRTALVEDQMIYPMNIAKTQACQVVRKGDYAALFLVGAVDMREDASEEEQLSFAKEEVQKAVDAFEGCF